MHPLHPAMTHLLALLATSLFTALWQGSLLTLGSVLCLRLLPALTAKTRSLLWLVVFLAAAVLPFGPGLLAKSHDTTGSNFDLRLGMQWAFALVAAWTVLSVYRATQLVRSAYLLHKLAKNSLPLVHGDDLAQLLTLRSNRVTRRKVKLCTSDKIDVPSVVGFLDPRILLPSRLVEEMSLLDIRQVVLHEMEHLRRGDNWTNLLQKLILVIFPLNLVLIWVERRLCVERELACDDGVLRATGASKAYATCLTNLAEQSMLRRRMILALTAWQRRSELALRVERILSSPQRNDNPQVAGCSAGLVLTLVAGASLLLLRSPQLIVFGSGAGTQALRATKDVPAAAFSQMATSSQAATSSEKAVRPTLVSATMPVAQRRSFATVSHMSPQRGPYAVAPVHQPFMRPRFALAKEERARGAQATFAIYQTSQFVYAAVPVQGGWLIVQL